MKLRINTPWILLLLMAMSIGQLSAEVRLPGIVSDGMILQRDEKVKIWGWADTGEKITITFLDETYQTKTNENGKWEVTLKPAPVGGPFEMTIKGNNLITLKNILFGDVWICSGQSNMTHYFGRHQERFAKEIADANYPEIRQFYVPTNPVISGPAKDIPEQHWAEATPETVLDFTVIGYFFAKKLYDKYKIPMGIINTAVGGTPIESWTSEEGFKEFPDIMERVTQLQDTAYVNEVNRKLQEARKKVEKSAPPQAEDRGLAGETKWYEPGYKPLNWKRINIPGYWEDQGVRNFDGVMWYRRMVDVPESMTGKEAMVKLGRIIDADELYINGEKVGNTTYQYPQRDYTMPADILKPGKNLFVVRVTNNGGKGGFVPDKPYYLLAGGDKVDLKGDWYYKVGKVAPRHNISGNKLGVRPIFAQNEPTALYNGMIAPFTNYAVKGFLWYQGESNAGNPDAYRELLPNLIHDWRNHWGLGDLTFLIAQLPNYMDVNYSPEESNWAEMREIQFETAQTLKNTGIGINIELGDWNDIHPGNKKPVGERLALAAMRITYGEKDMVTSGPIFKFYRKEDVKIILSFDHVGSGLVVNNDEELSHFAIAGEDKEFIWAEAKIVNNEVVVWSDEIKDPKYIRYAWADNPDFANLYNEEGLPASPFMVKIE